MFFADACDCSLEANQTIKVNSSPFHCLNVGKLHTKKNLLGKNHYIIMKYYLLSHHPVSSYFVLCCLYLSVPYPKALQNPVSSYFVLCCLYLYVPHPEALQNPVSSYFVLSCLYLSVAHPEALQNLVYFHLKLFK